MTRAHDGTVAALPLAAAGALLLARWLPVHFEYRPNELGIVSVATELRYPHQQETFFLFFGLAAGALLGWAVARVLSREVDARGAVALEGLGLAALLSVLVLPPVWALLSFAFAAAAVAFVARGSVRSPTAAPAGSAAPAFGAGAVFWLLLACLVAPLFAPSLSRHAYMLWNDIPDSRLVNDNFKFLAEAGQHLAWANTLDHGGFQGKHVFCLYGPLYDLGLLGLWKLVGRSVASWYLYWSLSRVLGWMALFCLAAPLVRRRWLLLLLPFLAPWVEMRTGLALVALLCLHVWLRSGRPGWCLASGLVAGVSLLFSQEFGVAFGLVAMIAFAVRREIRPIAIFAAGAAVVVLPVFGWYAANAALVPMLRDVAQYPAWLVAGYAKLPFPSLFAELPVSFSDLGERGTRLWRLGYAVPAVCLGGALLVLPISALDPRRPLASARAIADGLARDPARLTLLLVALFGLISFRSVLGRSDLHHLHAVLPAAVLLVVVGLDRSLDALRSASGLAVFRIAALSLLVAVAGFAETGRPVENARQSWQTAENLRGRGFHPEGDRRVLALVRWIEENAEPGEPVLFMPNDAAYYYLTDRPTPIRFVLGSQIVGDEHRAEVIADLDRMRPRFIVWDHDALKLDDLSDEQVFGREILDWIDRNYEPHESFSRFEIRRHKGGTIEP